MTLAEAIRAIESKKRQYKVAAQDRAASDYILADLIGRSVARIHSSSNKMPSLAEAYPTLFDDAEAKEKQQAQKDNISALRFKLFAQSFNSKYREVNKADG